MVGVSYIRLTTAQALIKWLANQFIEIDGKEQRICGGGFGIFGHGNVTCLGEALNTHREELPLYRGQNEQSMGFAAAGYSKQWLRQRFMFCTASAGPGTLNLVTASALGHANRLPMLFLCGDTFLTRLPDPVLQQMENFNDPTFGANDAFKPITRYWDRITHPAQIVQSLPNALATLLDPADCGPAFLGLPQDVQGWYYDYPNTFFERRLHRIRRQSPDPKEILDARYILKSARRPMIIAGGGVQYSCATEELNDFAVKHQIPVVETIAGRANMLHQAAFNCGPIGVTGSNSANKLAEKADVILAVGTRLQDFTTGSWAAFDHAAKFVSINAGRFDAGKHQSQPVVGDAKVSLKALSASLDYSAPKEWVSFAHEESKKWDAYVAANVSYGHNKPNSYAQAIGVVNALCDSRDRVVAAAGGLPAEITANWRTLDLCTVDVEFGFSCMGYEIAGAWGARIAQAEREPERDTISFCGDGSYLMLNSDIYSSVLSQKKLIILVLDNGGFAVINKLQNNTGNDSFNNLFVDCPTIKEAFSVNFAAHSASMGALSEKVTSPEELKDAFKRAKASRKTYVIVMDVDAHEGWTDEGHAWWEVGTPSISDNEKVRQGHADVEAGRLKQRRGV